MLKIKNNLLWDLDNDHIYPSPLIKKINFQAKKSNRGRFNNWIGKISSRYNKDLDWWLTIPSSRNPYLSNLYNYICKIETIQKLMQIKHPIKVSTASKSLFTILKKKRSKYPDLLTIHLKNKKGNNLIYILKSLFFYIFIFFSIKILKKKNVKLNKDTILMENFAIYSNKENLEYNRSFYQKQFPNLLLVPTFLIQKNLYNVLSIIKQLDNNKYVFKEHFIKFKDVLFSFLHFLRKKKFISKHEKYKNLNLSLLINEEVKSNKNYYSALVGILNFKFFESLKKNNIDIKKTINLFENQAAGRGWNLGSRNYFPDIKIIGYQSYPNFSQFMNSIPCEYEEKARILPKQIAISGKAFKNSKMEFFSKTKVLLAPALNYKNNTSEKRKYLKNTISLVLTGIKDIDIELLSWSVKFINENKKIKILIKFHPILPYKKIKNLIRGLNNKNITIYKKNVNSLLTKSLIIISTGPTSALYEAILKGCFVVVPVFDPWDKLNVVNCKIPRKNVTFANNFNDFCSSLNNLVKNKKKYNSNIKFKKEMFFENINKETEKIFK